MYSFDILKLFNYLQYLRDAWLCILTWNDKDDIGVVHRNKIVIEKHDRKMYILKDYLPRGSYTIK